MFQANPISYLASRAWEHAGKWRPVMLAYLGMFLCAQAMSLAEPAVIGRLLNAVQTAGSKATILREVYRAAILYAGLQLGFWIFHGPARVLERFVAFHVRAHFKAELFHRTSQLPLQWHRDHQSGEVIDQIGRATGSLYEFTGGGFEVIYMILRLVGAQLILLWFMPVAGLAAVLTTVLVLMASLAFDRALYDQYCRLNRFENVVASAIYDYVSNIVTVITLRLEEKVLREVRHRIEQPLDVFRRNVVINEVKWFSINMLIAAMVAAVISWHARSALMSGQAILAGTFFTLFEYLRRIGESFYNFAALYGTTVRQAADVRGVVPIEAAFAGRAGTGLPAPLKPGWQHVRIEEATFRHDDETVREHHLLGVSLDLVRGRSVALVGPSGSGKSTLLSLMRGLRAPDCASIAVDGNRWPDGLAHLKGVTTLMPQDPEIFADTIRFNITFGMDATSAQIEQALELARFKEVLARLPAGLETNIAERGVNLSGGEKQRLALARGIFFSRDSEVVLLDEPTSSVDTLNERLIYESLLELYRDRCVVSAIHKLHLLPLFDTVVLLDDGRVVESGRFADLIARDGMLARLWRSYQVRDPDSAGSEPRDVVAMKVDLAGGSAPSGRGRLAAENPPDRASQEVSS